MDLCEECGQNPKAPWRTICHGCKGRRRREAINRDKTRRRQELRLELLEAYGGKCVECGETDTDVLVFDHVNDDGHEHRRTVKNQEVYADLKRRGFPPVVQILCANDNMRKERRRLGFGSSGV